MIKDVKFGAFVSQGTYKAFIPEHIPRMYMPIDPSVLSLLSVADRAIGRLDMLSERIPDIDLFIMMHVVKEATQSSVIEGTQTSIEQVVSPEQDVPLDRRDEVREVFRYIDSMNESMRLLESIPLSSRLIRQSHKILLDAARGSRKDPGNFRRSQNWIGGTNPNNATFVPPPHHLVPDLIGDLELFINDEKTLIPDLLKIAMVHYQFETIHPFQDGNGRTGRLLIALYLAYKKILRKPVLYISDFFEKNRKTYYEMLMHTRKSGDIDPWLSFFLEGVISTCEASVNTLNKVSAVRDKYGEQTSGLRGNASAARKIIEVMYKRPVLTSEQLIETSGLKQSSGYALIKKMVNIGILAEMPKVGLLKSYSLYNYLQAFID